MEKGFREKIMAENSRKYTKSEQKRLDYFNDVKEELVSKGYKSHLLTINLISANIFSIFLFLLASIFFIPIYLKLNNIPSLNLSFDLNDIFLLFIAMAIFTVLHELVHGITWAMFTKDGFRFIR